MKRHSKTYQKKSTKSVYKSVFSRFILPHKPPALSEWSDANIILPKKSSAEHGKYKTSRTPYLREIMDSLSDNDTEIVVYMKPAQSGGTQAGLNWCGWIIDANPGPAMMLQPTLDMAKRLSKQRVQSMIDSCPSLASKVKPARERDSGNTLFVKEFTNGMCVITGANSATALRSMPVKYLHLDEVDAYPTDVDDEGSPADLAIKRTTTFKDRKIFISSTPTVKGFSQIEYWYSLSDMRQYYVPCPHCGHHQVLKWSNIIFQHEGKKIIGDVQYACESCGVLIDEKYKHSMVTKGEWRATAESKIKGYHHNALISPWTTWQEIATEHLRVGGDSTLLKTWVNTILAETFEESYEVVDEVTLINRKEKYTSQIPDGVIVLTAGVDIQKDRIESTIIGWGYGWESWVIEHRVLWGDTTHDDVWADLDVFLQTQYTDNYCNIFRVVTAVVDSGYNTQYVYRWVKPREVRRIYASKGLSDYGKPLVTNPVRRNINNITLFGIGTLAAKDIFYGRLNITNGPGAIHFPDTISDEYIQQLASEKIKTKYRKGIPYREYVKVRDRNEALDIYILNLAAITILRPNFTVLGNNLNKPTVNEIISEPEKKPITENPKKPDNTIAVRRRLPHKSNGWMSGYK